MRRQGLPARAALVLASGLVALPLSAHAAPAGSAGEAAAGGWETVVVSLRDHADLSGVTAPARPARLRTVVRTLRAVAERDQAPLTTRLDQWRALGTVASYQPLWVVNAVTVTATRPVIEAIAARSDVAAVTPDRIDLVPSTTATGPNLTTMRVPEVWDQGDTGSGVVVATLDSGADLTHADLESRWRGGTDSWFDPYGQHPDLPVDLSGHGTGTLGAIVGGDASGTAVGVAPGATWIAARVFDDRGVTTTTAVHQAFQWLLDPDHDPATADAPQVVNASWSIGSAPGCDLTFQPDVQALTTAGILPVFAAGNFGSAPGSSVSPANYPESLAVGALAGADTVLGSSSRGPSTCGGRTGPYPDVVAPGQDILTTDRFGLYQVASGTSMAAPQVAGALALLLAAHPGLTADQQRDLVTRSAVDLGQPGNDGDTGHGRVDVRAAFDLATTPAPDFAVTAHPTFGSVRAGGSVGFRVDVAATSGTPGDAAVTVYPPAGVAASAVPAIVPGATGSSTVTVSTSALTAPGDYQVPVDVDAGSTHHVVVLGLTVQPPVQPIELSTSGDANPPGVGGHPDDADVLAWDGTTFRRAIDASGPPYSLPTGANVDGFSRVDGRRFYISFSQGVRLPGLGWVQDEDVVLFDGSRWRVWFDGTAHGLTSSALDLDALSVAGTNVYFSTAGDGKPPGVGGTADDADIFRWDGHAFARVWDASKHGLAPRVDVDGLDLTDSTHFALSFANTSVALPGLGVVQDEDVLGYTAGQWRTVFDGTSAGLTTAEMDVDAFDLP